jgi:PAS domain S-box-containing protein
MQPAPFPSNEPQRIEALKETGLLDSARELAFDDLASIASSLCGTPVALVSLVDSHRQWFKAHHGLDVTETPRDFAFCGYTILGEDVFIVPDAHADDRFADNPLVLGEPRVRFYAGAPLTAPDGVSFGSLCVIDHEPRQLSTEQVAALRALGRQVVAQIQLRRTMRRLATEMELRRQLAEQSETFFAVTLDLLCVAGTDGRFKKLNPAWERVLGYRLTDLIDLPFLNFVHPEDFDRTVAEMEKLAAGAPTVGFENRYRRHDGTYRQLAWTASPDAATGLIYASAHDLTEMRVTERRLEEFKSTLDRTRAAGSSTACTSNGWRSSSPRWTARTTPSSSSTRRP